MERYQIGDIAVTWQEGNFPLQQDEYMQRFQIQEYADERVQDEIVYETHFLDLEKYSTEKLLQKNGLYELYETEEGKIIIYHWATCRFAFGFKLEEMKEGNIIPCYFHTDMKEQIALDAVRFFSCSGIHSKLLQKGAVIFHSAYVDWNGKGILFAGRSGVGKSTQAALWKKYADAEIINGDRTLIRRKNNIWNAYGYPCCGSSSICINRTLPLSAIILLEQGEENKIQLLSKGQKFRALFAGSEMYLWDEKEQERVSQIVGELIEEIKILKLICRPDAEAVEVLKAELEEE